MDARYELFVKTTCPYCQKVLRYLEGAGIELPLLDITRDPAVRERLVEVGGKAQVPCLFIDGTPMYESDDIIAYLKEHIAQA